ncbi:hypothetical protein [Streptomyces aureocirculatus]|uniref:hypothetical protein n=1 Tax=Streptomyces aureocirculatus TaxID=67275 RepID=UPI0004C54651|nr:hypothetical protein [Streptomyces aureocirculatus]
MTARTATKPAPAKTARQDDQPFDFNLDAVKAEVDLTPWRVHWNDRRWEFAHLQDLDVFELMAAAERGEVGAMLGVFEAALGEQFPEFRKIRLPQYKLQALFDAYRKFCGMAEGESQASSSS